MSLRLDEAHYERVLDCVGYPVAVIHVGDDPTHGATRKHYRKFVTKGVQCCNAVTLTFVLSRREESHQPWNHLSGGFVDEPMARPEDDDALDISSHELALGDEKIAA